MATIEQYNEEKRRRCAIYNANTGEKIMVFDSLKELGNHVGTPYCTISAYIKSKTRFGGRRIKGRKYKYEFPLLFKYED